MTCRSGDPDKINLASRQLHAAGHEATAVSLWRSVARERGALSHPALQAVEGKLDAEEIRRIVSGTLCGQCANALEAGCWESFDAAQVALFQAREEIGDFATEAACPVGHQNPDCPAIFLSAGEASE